MVSVKQNIPLLVYLYALGSVVHSGLRGAPYRKHYLCAPPVQCVHVLLVVISGLVGNNWQGILHQVSVAMLLALARFAGGQLAFRLVNFIGIQALFQSKADVTLSLRAFGITLHLFMLMVDLDGQGWHELRDNVQSALYAKEIALIRLGRVRELTIDDFWALPERFQLHAAHREFKYDENETLFVIRGIIRMIWRPYLPLVVFQSLFRIAVVSQSVLFTMVLMCIENPSTHAWYEPYLYLAANFSLQLIKSQAERVNRLLDQEEQRVKDSIKFEILRCALANLGKGGTNDMYVTHLVGSVMRGLRTVVSEISSVVTAVFALWLTYRQIGWISVIPIVVLVSLSLVSMSLDYLRRVCGYSRYTVWTSRVDARDIYSNIKTIKFNGWEQKYLDPTLVLNDDPDAYDSVKIPKKYRRLVDAFISTAQTANSILRNVSSQLAIFFTVNLYLQSGETLSSVELLQIIEQITQVKNNAQSVLSSYYLIAEAVNDNLRLEGYLTAEPTNGIAVQPGLPEAGPSIEMKDSTFTHTKKVETNVLEGVSLSIGRGQLVSVKGGVASGKTSLLLAMCGEVEMRSGAGHVTGRIGYLGQSPYIMNGTLRENILFGRDFDESLYWRVMEACALMGDADQWPKRDMTLIGERGINISGGQKARLALARAVYTQADVYILDDPLSAVDAQIKRHLLDNVLLNTGLLGNKLRVVSMNSNHLDAFANQNITVDKGQVTVEIQEHPRLHSLATLHGSCPEGGSGDDTMSEGSTSTLTNYVKPSSRRGDSRREHATKDLDMDKGINWDDAKYALDILGLPVLVLTLFTATFHPVSDYITEGYKLDALNKNSVAADPHAIGTYLWYQMLAATITNVVNTAESMLKRNIADKYVEERVINMFTRSLVYAPMSLFDSSSKQDIDSKFWMCKNELARRLPMLIQTNVSTILSISLSMYRVSRKAPLLLLIAPAMAIAMNHVGKLVIPTYRAVRKITRSFKIEQSRIRDILSDSSRTIRLHGVEGYFTSIHKGNVDEGVRLTRPRKALSSLSRTLVKVIDVTTSSVVTVIMVMQSQFTDYKLTSGELKVFGSLINDMVSSMSRLVDLRTRVVELLETVDLFRQFIQTPLETAWDEGGMQPPANWPMQGSIEFRNYCMRYTPDQDLVLKDISFTIKSGERIGIVGRTGAGKSSLTRALFRLVEGESGSILIDGIDIATLRADGLRPNITIIPQDPTIFNGSVKANLDPLQQYTIEDMWAALIKAELVDVVNPKAKHDKTKKDMKNKDSDSDYLWETERQRDKRLSSSWPMRAFLWLFQERRNTDSVLTRNKDWGLSKRYYGHGWLTSGQRQMFSLCRTLMRKRKILVLDEATADVDLKTDRITHDVIHKEFAGCTILTIAHRLETVMNSDRIIVMDHGTVAEFDTPANLLAKGGLFAELVKSNDFSNM